MPRRFDRLDRDPVAVFDLGDVCAVAAGLVAGPDHDAALIVVVFGLLALGLEDVQRRPRQRADTRAPAVRIRCGDDVEELRVEAVASVVLGLEESIAAREQLQRMRVLGVAELRLYEHVGAVDRAVLRILHVDREADEVAEVEEAAVGRLVERDRGSRFPTAIGRFATALRLVASVTVSRAL